MQATHRDSSDALPVSFITLAARFGTDAPQRAQSVAGGLSHRLWRLETATQSLALKVLSRRAVASPGQRALLERAEAAAEIAARAQIPALVARRGTDGNFLQACGAEWVLLFPWRDGQVLPPLAATPDKCALMGGFLGALHALKIRFPGQNAPQAEAFEAGHFAALLARATAQNAVWSRAVREVLAELEQANARAMSAQNRLREGWVTGHLDFDQKNVLWHEEKPLILDWESAKPIHPALELVGAGLSWAGQSAGETRRDSFEAFLSGYRRENPVAPDDLTIACEAVLGKWLLWLEFNLRRSLEPEIQGTNEEKICLDALFHALGATLQLQNDVAMYQNWCARK